MISKIFVHGRRGLLTLCMAIALGSSILVSFAKDSNISEFLHSPAPLFPTWNTFEALAVDLKGAGIANIFSKSSRVLKRKFERVPGLDTRLRLCEYFELIARQTKTTYHYEANGNTWMFEEPEMPVPFKVKLAPGWRMEDRGIYCAFIPMIAPIGMDIYMLGRFCDKNFEQLKEIRDAQALSWAKQIDYGANKTDMIPTTVDGCDALYYKCKARVEGRQWRQWSFFKNGQMFLIVSTVDDKNESKLIPDVEKMVASFKVKDKFANLPGFE